MSPCNGKSLFLYIHRTRARLTFLAERHSLESPERVPRAIGSTTSPPPPKLQSFTPTYSPTPSPPSPVRSLASLPVDILLRISEHLSPLSSTSSSPSGGPSHSSTWIAPPIDAINLSSTCRTLWRATRIVVQRKFGIVVREFDWEGGVESLAVRELDRIVDRLKRIRTTEEAVEEEPQTVPPQRIRDFSIHLSVPSTSEGAATLDVFLARAIRSLPRLHYFALVFLSEESVSDTSPFASALLGPLLVAALSESPTLSQLLLCGIDIAPRNVPMFGTALQEIVFAGVQDSALALIRKAPGLQEVKVWREYTGEPTLLAEEWWGEETWKTVEDIEMAGFGGRSAKLLFDTWRSTLVSLRTTPATIPLRSLCLPEPHTHETLVDLLKALALLPHLKSFTFLLWRERHFFPKLLGAVADKLPDLEELGIGLENEELNWWPGNLTEWARYLGQFKRLRTLTWNHTPYSDVPFDLARSSLIAPATLLASRSPQLRRIRWFGADAGLWRGEDGGAWRWDDEEKRRKERGMMLVQGGLHGPEEWGIEEESEEDGEVFGEAEAPLLGL